jgi:hypothetical protein
VAWLALDLRRKGKAKGDCMFCCAPLALTEGETCCGCKKKVTFREHGTFREHAGNMQGTFREHSGNI